MIRVTTLILGALGVPSAPPRLLAFRRPRSGQALATLAVLLSAPLGAGLGGSFCFGQNYLCDWSVVGIGGGDMAASNYRCGSTAGQTATEFITGPNYWALIGFWLPEGQVGVRDEAKWRGGQALVTHLYSPFPTPFSHTVTIRYSLATDKPATLEVFDRVGRQVRSWAVSRRPSAVSQLTWNGTDDRGRELANGVYFCRLVAGDYRSTEKLVLQR